MVKLHTYQGLVQSGPCNTCTKLKSQIFLPGHLDNANRDSLTSDSPIKCKGQSPCSIIAVLCVQICSVLVQIKNGRISVVTVGSVILIAILRKKG